VEAHDILVDCIVTPERSMAFSGNGYRNELAG
jgi:hypothetical protein